MSDSEEENFCFYGKPLEPYDEDAFPKKKPISVEDQIATDAQGRRRFHGAFTGGFSAGFFNTVGSLEGWRPSEFKSTRQDKAQNKVQKPQDFMDDEDMGEFGIAPQTVRATEDYATNKKRKRKVFGDGPIPGEPVLHSLLTSGNETIGYLLLKNIGMKDRGSGNKVDLAAEEKVYTCEMPRTYEISRNDDVVQYIIPDIYKEFLQNPKDNSFGLGYIGLNKGHVNLFKTSSLVIREPNKKKLSVTGQAFGVGAFEDDDEDIYVKDDMTKYDFELTAEKSVKEDARRKKQQTFFDDFIVSKNSLPPRPVFLPPTIPQSFVGKHKVKKSRFEPLPSETETVERKKMNSETRSKCWGQEISVTQNEIEKDSPSKITTTSVTKTPEVLLSKVMDHNNKTELTGKSLSSSLMFDRFVTASTSEDVSNILEVVPPSELTHGTQEMRDAARMKMFGPLTRITEDWQPCSLLCKRFNVPEPSLNELNSSKSRKRTKNLIFEYEKLSDMSTDFKSGLSVANSEVANIVSTIPESGTVTDAVPATEVESKVEEGNTAEKEEEPIDITDKLDVDKNIDLFKAIFLSSSESDGEGEDEEKEKEQRDKNQIMKSSVLSDNLLPKIKPIKEGILSNVDFGIFEKNPVASSQEKQDEVGSVERNTDDSMYGPSLPNLPKAATSSNDEKIQYQVCNDDNDEWVEKGKSGKKHKTQKHKKSSHKRKHKRR